MRNLLLGLLVALSTTGLAMEAQSLVNFGPISIHQNEEVITFEMAITTSVPLYGCFNCRIPIGQIWWPCSDYVSLGSSFGKQRFSEKATKTFNRGSFVRFEAIDTTFNQVSKKVQKFKSRSLTQYSDKDLPLQVHEKSINYFASPAQCFSNNKKPLKKNK